MPKTKEITTYSFDELSDSAKEKAREWMRDSNYSYYWWKDDYDDAKQIGLRITAFELDRYCHGEFINGAEEVADAILKNHSENTPTYNTAKEYLSTRDAVVDDAPRDEDGVFDDEHALDDQLDELESEFLKSLLEDYRITLQNDYEFMQTNEYVDDLIESNGYEFKENGELA